MRNGRAGRSDALAPCHEYLKPPANGSSWAKETHAATRSSGEIAQMRSNSEQRAEARSGEIG
jgi:hypothetical protein